MKNSKKIFSISINEWKGSLTISAIYCPPRHTVKKDEFSNYFKTLGKRFIAGGDYNAKHPLWGSRLTTPKGRQLWQAMTENNLSHLSTGQPTYWPSDLAKVPDLIDFCVTKGIQQPYIKVESCLDLSSDHSTIIVTLSSHVQLKKTIPRLHNHKTDWEMFRYKVIAKLINNIVLRCEQDIDRAVDMFNENITESARKATPKMLPGKIINACTLTVRQLIKHKRELRKRWQITRSSVDKTKLNKAIKTLKHTLYEEKNETIQKYLKGLAPTQASDYSPNQKN